MMSLWPCCLRLVLLTLILVDESASKCRDGYYYAFHKKRCRKCSTNCTEEYIVMPCSEFADVICERPIPSRAIYPTEVFNEGSSYEGYHHLRPHMSGASVHKDSTSRGSYAAGPDHGESGSEGDLGLTMEEKHNWKNWKTLALVLKALLCLLIVMATVVVVVACFKLQKALVLKQNEEPDIDDADSGYVVIRTIRDASGPRTAHSDMFPPNERLAHPPLLASQDTELGSSDGPSSFSSPGQPLCFLPRVYTPQRRLLSYDADDVFESDDQTQHQTIPQRPEQFATNRSFFHILRGQNDKSRRKKKKKTLEAPGKHSSGVKNNCFGKRQKEHLDTRVDLE